MEDATPGKHGFHVHETAIVAISRARAWARMRALVFHLKADTGKQHQPSGDAGDPIACGVIERT